MSKIENLLGRYMTNKIVYLDGAEYGKEVLHTILTNIQQRLENTANEKVQQEAHLMRIAMGDALQLAYEDFRAFSEKWECKAWYYDHPTTSNIFVLYFAEKCENGYQHHFRFAGLKNN